MDGIYISIFRSWCRRTEYHCSNNTDATEAKTHPAPQLSAHLFKFICTISKINTINRIVNTMIRKRYVSSIVVVKYAYSLSFESLQLISYLRKTSKDINYILYCYHFILRVNIFHDSVFQLNGHKE